MKNEHHDTRTLLEKSGRHSVEQFLHHVVDDILVEASTQRGD